MLHPLSEAQDEKTMFPPFCAKRPRGSAFMAKGRKEIERLFLRESLTPGLAELFHWPTRYRRRREPRRAGIGAASLHGLRSQIRPDEIIPFAETHDRQRFKKMESIARGEKVQSGESIPGGSLQTRREQIHTERR